MVLVDTNVLVYAAGEDFAEHRACRTLLETWRASVYPWYLTWPILYEFLRVVTHPRVFSRPWDLSGAFSFVDSLLDSPGLTMLVESSRHRQVFEQLVREIPDLSGNLLNDTHTAVLMREHGIRRICTRNTDFHRFSFLEVIDPLRVQP